MINPTATAGAASSTSAAVGYYFVDAGKQTRGPIAASDWPSLTAAGHATASSMVWAEGWAEWVAASTVAALKSAAPAPAAAAAAAAVGGAEAGGGGAAAPGAAADGSGYAMEDGRYTYTNPAGEAFVWDEDREDWLPREQFLYMSAYESAEPPPVAKKPAGKKRTAAEAAAANGGDAAKAANEAAAKKEPFIEAAKFSGVRAGYSYKTGDEGVGYYLDPAAAAAVETAEELERKRRRKEKKKEWRKQKKKATWQKPKVNCSVYLSGLPSDVTVEEVVEFAGRCGVVKSDPLSDAPKVKLYRDSEGRGKGDGSVTYLKEPSVALAIEMLDGAQMRPGCSVKVSEAVFEQKGKYVERDAGLTEEQRKRLQVRRKEQMGKLGWNDDGVETGGNGLKMVIFQNCFDPTQPSCNYERVKSSLEVATAKLGAVDKVHVFEGNAAGAVLVKFKDPAVAETALEQMQGLEFDGRELRCEYFDGVTDYRAKVKEEEVAATGDDDADEEKRLENFGTWLEGGDSEFKKI